NFQRSLPAANRSLGPVQPHVRPLGRSLEHPEIPAGGQRDHRSAGLHVRRRRLPVPDLLHVPASLPGSCRRSRRIVLTPLSTLSITIAGVDRTAYLCAPGAGSPATFQEALRERKQFTCEFVSRD